jgi:hypothetical protein
VKPHHDAQSKHSEAAGARSRHVIYDGRDLAGRIRRYTNVVVAYDAGGKLVGRYPTQQQALRAIPASRRRAGSAG